MERVAARVSARVRSEGTRAGSGTLCTEGGAPVAAASRRLPSSSPPAGWPSLLVVVPSANSPPLYHRRYGFLLDDTADAPLALAFVHPQSPLRIPRRAGRGQLQVVAVKKATKKVEVVLSKNVPELGSTGSIKKVSNGYFKNFLQPQGLAEPVTDQVME